MDIYCLIKMLEHAKHPLSRAISHIKTLSDTPAGVTFANIVTKGEIAQSEQLLHLTQVCLLDLLEINDVFQHYFSNISVTVS